MSQLRQFGFPVFVSQESFGYTGRHMFPGKNFLFSPHPVRIKMRVQTTIRKYLLPQIKIKAVVPAVKPFALLPGLLERRT